MAIMEVGQVEAGFTINAHGLILSVNFATIQKLSHYPLVGPGPLVGNHRSRGKKALKLKKKAEFEMRGNDRLPSEADKISLDCTFKIQSNLHSQGELAISKP